MSKPQVSSITVSLFGFMLPMISIDINIEEKLVSIKKFPETEAEIKTISNLRIFVFLNQLKRVKLSEWKEYYPNEMEILDGTQWHVSFVMNGRTYDCSGDNNYPREWMLFCRAINRLAKCNYLD
ncbi:TPA: hypothetical protein U1B12_001680 [Streptococcus suis]|uniref:hypothetical protein n=1 Tax=Streptococcus suis TaxID=1307 RepID=UPI00201B19A7|nr:hypothetical protein [Streptococcus suis]MCL4939480.1 hypothetical protein [Streptococcus suis]MCO8201111.1 hypothetical protein [Streptococcus suis]MCO8218649.1 hypothetical protein [Streptococcus suis]HEM3468519.1 hypothetical protein [Streptococcus suis]HEM3479232.1 hypothetical protein [Streptococcus suis]